MLSVEPVGWWPWQAVFLYKTVALSAQPVSSFSTRTCDNLLLMNFALPKTQEYSLENTLDKMQAEWGGQCFETTAWRATGCTILRAVDDIQQVH